MKTQEAQILVKTKGTWTKVAFLSIFLSHCLVVQWDNDVTFLLQCSSFSCVAQVKQMYMYNHYEQVQLYFSNNNWCHVTSTIYKPDTSLRRLACEQAFGRAGWGEGKAKRPVDKHLRPLFHGTRCASDPDASSYWQEHWLLTGLIDISFSVSM